MKKAFLIVIVLLAAVVAANDRTDPVPASAQEEMTYPYQAEVSPGLQLTLEYNYEISPRGEFVVVWRASISERIDALTYWIRALDGQGKDLSTRLERVEAPALKGLHYAFYYGGAVGPWLPDSIVTGTSRGEIREGATGPVRAEILITSYRVGGVEVSLFPPDLGNYIV